MAVHCGHCNATDLTPLLSTSQCSVCGWQTAADGTPVANPGGSIKFANVALATDPNEALACNIRLRAELAEAGADGVSQPDWREREARIRAADAVFSSEAK